MNMWLRCYVLILCPYLVCLARILFLADEIKSHIGMFSVLGDELSKQGHAITWYLNENLKVPANLKSSSAAEIVTYQTQGLDINIEKFYEEITQAAMQDPGNVRHFFGAVSETVSKMVHIVLTENEGSLTTLESMGFDIVVVDGYFMTKHKYLIAHRLKVPIVTLTDAVEPWVTRVPWLPSFVPMSIVPFSDRLTFMERVQNLFIYLAMFSRPLAPSIPRDLLDTYGVDSVDDVIKTTQLWITTSDPVLDYPKPEMPNMIACGGIATKPANSLEDPWSRIVEEAQNGIVLVSFGSIASTFPTEISQKLLKSFGQLKHTVIWRFRNKENHPVPPNVFISEWIPQNDLLAQPKVKVFITHCGNNGQFEAVYHAVPMVGMPIFGDQFHNAERLVHKQYGLEVSMQLFKPFDLVNATEEVIYNPIYYESITKASNIFHDRPETPAERAASGIDIILKYGGKHLRSYAVDMPLYEFIMLDVFAFVCVLLVVAMCLIKFTIKKMFQICWPRRQTKLKAQ